MTNETEKCEQILTRLAEMSTEENLQMREAQPMLYTPYKGLLIPELHRIKGFSIEPQNSNRDFPQIEVRYNASIGLSEVALEKWEETSARATTMEEIIREFSPVITFPHIIITLEMWLEMRYRRRREYVTEEKRRYVVDSDGLVIHSPRMDSGGWGKYANYKNFTNKPYEPMFKYILEEFKQLAGS